MGNRRAIRPVSAAGLVLAAVAMATGAAAADEPQTEEQHCVITVVGQLASGEFVTAEPVCVASASRASVVDDLTLGTESTVTLGVHYDGLNGSGSSVTVVGSSCTGGYWNTSPTWDNRISSSFNGCARLRHYDLADKGGSWADTTGWGTTDNLPGWMDNRTESVAYLAS